MKRWMTLLLAGALVMGCGGKGGGEDDDADTSEDTGTEVTDGTDTGDDTEGDPTVDSVEDTEGDSPVDSVEDTASDVPSDCETSEVGSAPSDLTDSCAKVGACVDPAAPGDTTAWCLLVSMFGDWQPLYGDWATVLIAEAANALWGEVEAQQSCIAAAADCDAVFQCLHGGTASPTCTMPDASIDAWPQSCDGTELVFCVNVDPTTTGGREIIVPCPGTTTCMAPITGYAGCFYDTCTTAETEPSCRAGDIEQCIAAGVHMVIDCGEMARGAGGRCSMEDDGTGTGTLVASCIPAGRACDPTTWTDTCSGDDLEQCAMGHEFSTDCTAIGTEWYCNTTSNECVPDVSGWTCSVPDGGMCDCDDLIFCDITVGDDVRLHCPDYGLSTCVESSGEAACIP